MSAWYSTLDDSLWLAPDHTGEEEAAFLRSVLRLREGSRVLDAPCGTARIAYHLARLGCEITGVELRKSFIRQAQSRFRRHDLKARFLIGDLRDMCFDEQFHAAINWGGSFGYFADADNGALVDLYAQALRRGGRLLIDQVNRERVLRNFVRERSNGEILHKSRWDARSQRLITRRVIDGIDESDNCSSVRLYTPGQIGHLLNKAGLSVEAFYGSHAGDLFTRSSRRMIAVGRKA